MSLEATELLLPVVSLDEVEGDVLAVVLEGLLLVLLVSVDAVVLEPLVDGVVLAVEDELEGLVASVSPVEVEDDGELVLAVELLDGLEEDVSVLAVLLEGDVELLESVGVVEAVPAAEPLTPKLPEAPVVLDWLDGSELLGVVLE